jgi:choline kinase
LYGDSNLVCDYTSVARALQQAGKVALMTVSRNGRRWDTSNVEYENGRILAYSKKHRTPRMQYIDYGLRVFSSKTFEGLSEGGACDLADLYGQMLSQGQLVGMEVRQRFYEIGSPAGPEETAKFLAEQGLVKG